LRSAWEESTQQAALAVILRQGAGNILLVEPAFSGSHAEPAVNGGPHLAKDHEWPSETRRLRQDRGGPKSGDFGCGPRKGKVAGLAKVWAHCKIEAARSLATSATGQETKKGRGASLRRRTSTSILKRIRSRLNPSSRHANTQSIGAGGRTSSADFSARSKRKGGRHLRYVLGLTLRLGSRSLAGETPTPRRNEKRRSQNLAPPWRVSIGVSRSLRTTDNAVTALG